MSGLGATAPADGGPIRTAVVGLGWAARSIWLPRLERHPAFAAAAAVDPDPAVRATAAREHPGPALLASVDQVRPEEIDLAVVAVPNHLHCAVACALLERGVPVFLEKPVCLDSAEAARLAEAERSGGAVLLAGSAARCRADVRALAELAAKIGTVRHVDVSWVRSRGIPSAGGWFTDRAKSGGGALVDLGWHLLDVLTDLLGPVAVDQVVGSVTDDFLHDGAWRAVWRKEAPTAAGGDVEDTARAFLVTGNGVSASLRASWASHEPRDVTAIRIEGSAGTAELRCTFGFSPNRDGGPVLTLTRDGEPEAVAVPDEEIGAEYHRQLDELAALLADPAARGRAVADATRTIGVIERVYASAARTRR
ncbi:Gfo/Idh/MocA family oxidoreductase [Saccharopolyspora cebuensis]|uniref:Gfo/Idh/MocA family protein n=1 Tax=Saccharopolyspora cebuensis TaxID=418759 RepID=A0ABV4CIP7_9PSEU